MFTGIIEEIGTAEGVRWQGSSSQLSIHASMVLEGTRTGDSIAVNGVCLTVTELRPTGFTADVMAETLRRSNLGELRPGTAVNLERALAADGRFGGHLVSGHIDGVGRIVSFRREGNSVWIAVETEPAILELIVEKGSVAIDGVSLTVAGVSSSQFQVSVIPHTGAQTALLDKLPGSPVNLENDVIGKYVKKLLGGLQSGGITEAFLMENGF